MRCHTVVHPSTTICFVNPFVFKNKIEKEGLPRDGPAGLGAGGPRFKSGRPDQNNSSAFMCFATQPLTLTSLVEIRQAGGLISQIL